MDRCYSREDPAFSNLLEVVGTPRPGVDSENSDRADLDETAYYSSINGKLGLFAELQDQTDKQ